MRPWIRGIGSAFTSFHGSGERRLRLIENGRPEVLVYESWKMVGDALYAGVTMYEANNSGNVNWKK